MAITPGKALAGIESAARSAGMEVVHAEVAGRSSVVARTSQFRWRWVATRLHTFVIASAFDGEPPSRAGLDAYLRDSVQYAITNKGGVRRGLQSGTAAVAVAVVDRLAPDVADWATARHGGKWAAMTYPVSVEVDPGRLTRPERMIIGGVYSSYLRELVDRVVAPALRAE